MEMAVVLTLFFVIFSWSAVPANGAPHSDPKSEEFGKKYDGAQTG